MKLLSPIVDNKDLVNKEYVDTNATSTSVLPNDNGEIKTKYRISNKSNTSTGTWYYPLCKLPKDDTGNYASAIISGRIGGWVNSNMSSISALAWNRNGTGISLLDIAGGATNMNNIWSICDIVIYTDASPVSPSSTDDGIDIIYLKCHSYFTFDLNVELFQSTAVFMYDGTYLTQEPSGTLVAQASTSNKRVEIVNSKLYVAGNEVATSANIVTGVKGDSESTYHTGNVNITKANIGLGNVGNFKAVSTVASQGLTDTEKANARANIGAGTSSLTLGTTSSTAYRGDYGNTAYTHATDSSRLTTAKSSGLYKVASTSEGHIASLTTVEKSDITALGIPGSDTNTTYTLSADTTNNKVVLTPSSGTAQSITVPYATKALGDKNGNDIVNTYVQNSNYYLNTHPENTPVVIPFIHNDISFLKVRGGSYVVEYDGTTQSQNIDSVFDGSPSYWAINPTGITTITITLTLHKVFTWSNTVYFDFGSSGWRSKNIKIEAMNSNFADDVWSTKLNMTDNTKGNGKVTFSHTPVGASSASGGFNKLRFTFSSWNSSTIFRIAQLGVYNYGSLGVRETFMSRGIDDEVMRNITPITTGYYNLGSSSKRWANVYTSNLLASTNINLAQKHWLTNQVSGDDNDLVLTVNEVSYAVLEAKNNTKTIRPSNTTKGVLDLGTSSNKYNNVYANTFNGNLSGTIASSTTATTQSSGDNSTKVATTAFVTSAIGTVQTPIYSGSTPPSDTSKIWYDTTTNTFMYYDQTSGDWEESNSPDVMSEVLRITGDLQNQINNMDDTVGELQVESATHITQTDAETLVNASASSLSADIQTAYDTLDGRITSLNSNLTTSIQAVDNKYDGYIDIANKGSSNPTLSLSTPTSNLSINTTNSNIKIKSGTNDIVTINSDKLSSTHLEATETLGIGNFGWVVQTSGHVTLKKLT